MHLHTFHNHIIDNIQHTAQSAKQLAFSIISYVTRLFTILYSVHVRVRHLPVTRTTSHPITVSSMRIQTRSRLIALTEDGLDGMFVHKSGHSYVAYKYQNNVNMQLKVFHPLIHHWMRAINSHASLCPPGEAVPPPCPSQSARLVLFSILKSYTVPEGFFLHAWWTHSRLKPAGLSQPRCRELIDFLTPAGCNPAEQRDNIDASPG